MYYNVRDAIIYELLYRRKDLSQILVKYIEPLSIIVHGMESILFVHKAVSCLLDRHYIDR